MAGDHLVDDLRCPRCASGGKEGRLEFTKERTALACLEPSCGMTYPIHDGLPVMLTEEGDFLGYREKVMSA